MNIEKIEFFEYKVKSEIDERELLNMFSEDIKKQISEENVAKVLIEAASLIEKGFISIFDERINFLIWKSKEVYEKLGFEKDLSKEEFDCFNGKFNSFINSYDKFSDELKIDAILPRLQAINDRDEQVHFMVDEAYDSFKKSREYSGKFSGGCKCGGNCKGNGNCGCGREG